MCCLLFLRLHIRIDFLALEETGEKGVEVVQKILLSAFRFESLKSSLDKGKEIWYEITRAKT